MKAPRSGVSSSAPRLDRAGVKAPVARKQYHAEGANDQVPCRRARRRKCILKDCECWFQPKQPQERYCSDACRKEGERWRRWRASQGWRASERGKECRRCQSRRYRERQRQRREALQLTCLKAKGEREGQAQQQILEPFRAADLAAMCYSTSRHEVPCRSIVRAVAAKRCVGCGNVKHAGVGRRRAVVRRVVGGRRTSLSDRRILQWDAAVDYFLLAPNGEGSGRGRWDPPVSFL